MIYLSRHFSSIILFIGSVLTLQAVGQNATIRCLDDALAIDRYLIKGIRTSRVCEDTSKLAYQKAIQLAAVANEVEKEAVGHFHLAELFHRDISNLDKALFHVKKAIQLTDDHSCGYIKSRAYLTLGRIYSLMPNKMDSVIVVLNRAEEVTISHDGGDYFLWWIVMSKFNYYQRIGSATEADSCLSIVLDLTRTRNKKDDHGYVLIRALEFYKNQENKNRHDEIYREFMRRFGSKKGKTNFEKLNQRDYVMLMANKLKLAELNMAKRKNMIAVLIGLLFALLALLGYYGWYRNQRLSQKLKAKNMIIGQSLDEKSMLLKEIHHRVKNNLQIISSLLYLQADYVDDHTANKVLQEGQNRIKSMALIHKNLYQEDNLKGIDMKVYFDKLIESLFRSYKIPKNRIQLTKTIQPLSLDVDTVIPIALIVNELISNSLEHAFEEELQGQLKVSLIEHENEILLSVQDNGVGLSDEMDVDQMDSFGFELIRLFAQKLNADLTVQSNNGCLVQLNIKKYKRA